MTNFFFYLNSLIILKIYLITLLEKEDLIYLLQNFNKFWENLVFPRFDHIKRLYALEEHKNIESCSYFEKSIT